MGASRRRTHQLRPSPTPTPRVHPRVHARRPERSASRAPNRVCLGQCLDLAGRRRDRSRRESSHSEDDANANANGDVNGKFGNLEFEPPREDAIPDVAEGPECVECAVEAVGLAARRAKDAIFDAPPRAQDRRRNPPRARTPPASVTIAFTHLLSCSPDARSRASISRRSAMVRCITSCTRSPPPTGNAWRSWRISARVAVARGCCTSTTPSV